MADRTVKLVGGPHSDEQRQVDESTHRYIISTSRKWDHHYVQHRYDPDQFVYESSMEVKSKDQDIEIWFAWSERAQMN